MVTRSFIPQETESVGKIVERYVEHSTEMLNTRIEGLEKAFNVFQDNLTRVPTQVDRAIEGLRELIEAEIRATSMEVEVLRQSTEGRIDKLDIQFQERTNASSTAIAAALQAAKEAVGEQNKSSAAAIAKSDAAVAKQVDQMTTTLTTSTKALDDKIADLKERLNATENRYMMISNTTEGRRLGSRDTLTLGMQVVMGASAIASVLAIVMSIFAALKPALGH